MAEVWTNPDVAISDLPRVENRKFHPHPVRYKAYRNFNASVFWAFPVLVYAIVVLTSFGTWAYVVGAVLVVLLLLVFFGIYMGYYRRSYALSERDVTYRKGWIFYSTTTIPFNRIQHTEVSQGPIERRYNLSTLKIYTAGGSSSDMVIPGLEDEEAKQLRDFISEKAAIYA